MPPLYRVATSDTFASESTLETVQESEVPRDSMSTCDTYMGSPALSSTYSTSPGTPSSTQTSFGLTDEAWHKASTPHAPGGIPANDWGYELYHSESRLSDASSTKTRSVKSSKGFGFSRKKSIGDLAPGMAQLEPFKVKTSQQAQITQGVPLTLNQLDILRGTQVHRPLVSSRQQVPHQSRLAALAKFGQKEQVTGAVKLVTRSKGEEGVETGCNADADSIFTTITTTSTSSGGSDIVPVYGRGGAGRAAGAKIRTQIYGSIDDLSAIDGVHSTDNLEYDGVALGRPRGSSTSGTSGGKAFLGKLCGKVGSGSDSSRADSGSASSGGSQNSNKPVRWHLNPAASSRDSIATIHSSTPEEKVMAYGRGGAARKSLAIKEKEHKVEEGDKPKSRAVALMGSMRNRGSTKTASACPETVDKPEAMPAYGRGGAARKNKH